MPISKDNSGILKNQIGQQEYSFLFARRVVVNCFQAALMLSASKQRFHKEWRQLFKRNYRSIKPTIKALRKSHQANKKLYTCFATANALGKFSWGNLPFPQTPMDAIFFKIMPEVYHSD